MSAAASLHPRPREPILPPPRRVASSSPLPPPVKSQRLGVLSPPTTAAPDVPKELSSPPPRPTHRYIIHSDNSETRERVRRYLEMKDECVQRSMSGNGANDPGSPLPEMKRRVHTQSYATGPRRGGYKELRRGSVSPTVGPAGEAPSPCPLGHRTVKELEQMVAEMATENRELRAAADAMEAEGMRKLREQRSASDAAVTQLTSVVSELQDELRTLRAAPPPQDDCRHDVERLTAALAVSDARVAEQTRRCAALKEVHCARVLELEDLLATQQPQSELLRKKDEELAEKAKEISDLVVRLREAEGKAEAGEYLEASREEAAALRQQVAALAARAAAGDELLKDGWRSYGAGDFPPDAAAEAARIFEEMTSGSGVSAYRPALLESTGLSPLLADVVFKDLEAGVDGCVTVERWISWLRRVHKRGGGHSASLLRWLRAVSSGDPDGQPTQRSQELQAELAGQAAAIVDLQLQLREAGWGGRGEECGGRSWEPVARAVFGDDAVPLERVASLLLPSPSAAASVAPLLLSLSLPHDPRTRRVTPSDFVVWCSRLSDPHRLLSALRTTASSPMREPRGPAPLPSLSYHRYPTDPPY